MRFHPEVPLVALFGLMHFGITLARAVLGRTRRRDQRGIDHCAAPEQQALGGQSGVDHGQDLDAQVAGGKEFFDKNWSYSVPKIPDIPLVAISSNCHIY